MNELYNIYCVNEQMSEIQYESTQNPHGDEDEPFADQQLVRFKYVHNTLHPTFHRAKYSPMSILLSITHLSTLSFTLLSFPYIINHVNPI
jgi:hypothetical protein